MFVSRVASCGLQETSSNAESAWTTSRTWDCWVLPPALANWMGRDTQRQGQKQDGLRHSNLSRFWWSPMTASRIRFRCAGGIVYLQISFKIFKSPLVWALPNPWPSRCFCLVLWRFSSRMQNFNAFCRNWRPCTVSDVCTGKPAARSRIALKHCKTRCLRPQGQGLILFKLQPFWRPSVWRKVALVKHTQPSWSKISKKDLQTTTKSSATLKSKLSNWSHNWTMTLWPIWLITGPISKQGNLLCLTSWLDVIRWWKAWNLVAMNPQLCGPQFLVVLRKAKRSVTTSSRGRFDTSAWR